MPAIADKRPATPPTLLNDLVLASEQFRRIERAYEAYARATIRALRITGTSWVEIAAALGTTKQAAWERFGRPLP